MLEFDALLGFDRDTENEIRVAVRAAPAGVCLENLPLIKAMRPDNPVRVSVLELVGGSPEGPTLTIAVYAGGVGAYHLYFLGDRQGYELRSITRK